MESVKSMSYIELEEQWGGMLHKFAQWKVPGLEYDDVKQELRIVLYKAQQKYNSKFNASFTTYIYRAFLNKVRKLEDRTNALKRIPMNSLLPLCDSGHDEGVWCLTCTYPPMAYDDTELLDLLGHASPEAQQIAVMSLRGETTRSAWTESGLSNEQIKTGLKELKGLIRPRKE